MHPSIWVLQSMKDEFVKLENKFVKLDGKGEIDKKYKDMEKLVQLEQDFQQIQENLKTESSHDTKTIVNQVEGFIGNVKSLPNELRENNNRPIKEERALIIDVAKQFQETVLLHY